MFDKITPKEFLLYKESEKNWQLLDVREEWEVNIASVKDAIHIPMSEIFSKKTELDLNKPVAVLCHSGVRSTKVSEILVNEGFKKVANIEGGIDAWSEQIDSSLPRY